LVGFGLILKERFEDELEDLWVAEAAEELELTTVFERV